MTDSDHDRSQAIENTDPDTFRTREGANCPERNGENSSTGGHTRSYELLGADDPVAVRASCSSCGELLGEWDSRDAALEAAYDGQAIGICPHCDNTVMVNPRSGRLRDGETWHDQCWFINRYGFERIDDLDAAPYSSSVDAPYNMKRSVETDIAGSVIEWTEFVRVGLYFDYLKTDLPTRDELSPDQLATLREWALRDNPTGERKEETALIGRVPARQIVLGADDQNAPENWICPDCGEIVHAAITDNKIDLSAECLECGSDRWLTHGRPLLPPATDALEPLSGRERQIVLLTMMGSSIPEAARQLDIETSTAREYLNRAREKARRGRQLYERMDEFGVLPDSNN